MAKMTNKLPKNKLLYSRKKKGNTHSTKIQKKNKRTYHLLKPIIIAYSGLDLTTSKHTNCECVIEIIPNLRV